MRTDIARVSFDELNHYTGVFHQMGRLPLEADFNEQNELVMRLLQRFAGDAVHTGSANDGFRVDTRVLVDRMDTRAGWAPTPATGTVFIDYFDHRVGDGSLVVVDATAVEKTLAAPLDLSQATEVVIAMKTVPGPAPVFFIGDGATTHPFTMTDLFVDGG